MHAVLAPSSAPVWGFCSGSVAAAAAHPQPETEDTRTGDAAHWVGSECLNAWRGASAGSQVPGDYVGTTAPNGVVIDYDVSEGVSVYVDDVIRTLSAFDGGKEALMVEHRVYMPRIHAANWGTLDAAARIGNRVYIWDYKNGHGGVEAEGNLQLVDYLEGIAGSPAEIDARIVQPNSYSPGGPVRRWRTSYGEIEPLVGLLHTQAIEVMTIPTLSSGRHCRYCAVRGTCSANRAAGYNLIDVVKAPVAFDVMSGSDLAVERKILQRGATMLKARLEAIDDELGHRVKSGDASCGLALESVVGPSKWSVSPEQATAAARMFGIDIRTPSCKTPAQAKAALPPAMRSHFDMATKSITNRRASLKLIDSCDSLAARVFSKRD